MRFNRTLPLLAGALFLIIAPLDAAKVKTWQHHRPDDYDSADLSGVVVNSEGGVRLGRACRPLADLQATHAWSVVEDKSGQLYAVTGDEGKVYRIAKDGSAKVAWSCDPFTASLVADPRGDGVFVGTGTNATIARVDEQGGKILCELPESYIWALAIDAKGENLYAATGPLGRIYRVTAAGKFSVFFETKQDHVLSLALADDGTLYAGTDKSGRVYRIDPKGKGFLLARLPQNEARTMLLLGDDLYVGTSGGKRGSQTTSEKETKLSSKSEPIEPGKTDSVRASTTSETIQKLSTGKTASKTKSSAKGKPAAAPSKATVGENSVYRIGKDGMVREIFRMKGLVMCLANQREKLLVGTGMHGQLYEISPNSRLKVELAKLPHGQILGLCARKNGGVVLAAGDPGKLYTLEEGFVNKGTLSSEVLDAKSTARFGAIRWRADVPQGTTLSVAVRSGNVLDVDDTWSDWSAEMSDPESAKCATPAARYLQYRVTLKSESVTLTPTLHSVTLSYAPTNLMPEIIKIKVPDLMTTSLDHGKKMKIEWTAEDANEDELRYRILVKKDGWSDWVTLEDDYEKTEFEWDTTTTPSGTYRLKIVADDSVDNPEKETLTTERISEPFVVCHTPPTVKLIATKLASGKVRIEATAQSPLVRLTAASFAINGRKWTNVFPDDGLFDGKHESFSFETETLPTGNAVIVLKVQDAAGNTGSADIVIAK
jgi:outer membrane protein assembly factor BamB